MDEVRVGLLGPVEVRVAGETRAVSGLRRRAVLAALALTPGHIISSARLIEIAWEREAAETKTNTLHSHLTFLRREYDLHGMITARRHGYLLDLGDERTDVQVAEQAIHAARHATDPSGAAQLLRNALVMWRGPALLDLRSLTWFSEQAVRLDTLRHAALTALTDARLALGEHRDLVAELGHAVEQSPLDERLHRQLMTALYRSGRQTDALSLYQRLKARLWQDLNAQPEQASRELEAAILRQSPELDLASAASAAVRITHRGAPVRLLSPPAYEKPTLLVERDREQRLIDEAVRAAAEDRCGTVLHFEGPPGIGKTTLLAYAEAVGREQGCTVLTASGWEIESEAAWACVRQMFGGLFADEHAEPPSAGSALAHQFLSQWSQGGAETPLTEYALVHSLYWLVVDLAERGPVVLLADDMNWFDVPSARFLAYLAARIDSLSVVLITCIRKETARINHVLPAFTPVTHTLPPLTGQGSTELVAAMTGLRPDDPVMSACRRLSAGNPLLLRQLSRRINQALAAGQDPVKALDRGLPAISMLVRTQLRDFPQSATTAANALAVLGEESAADALALVAATSPQQIMEGLDVLDNSAYVTERRETNTFSFTHPLIAAAVYEGIEPGLRAELHLRAAGAAMRTHDVVGAASHLLRVPARWGDVDAVSVLGQAAEVCLARGSVDSAVVFLRRQLEEDLGADLGHVLTRLGMAEYLVDTGQAAQHLAAALELESDPDNRARITLALAGSLFFAGAPSAAVRVCEEALSDSGIPLSAHQALRACMVDAAYPARDALGLSAMIEQCRVTPTDTTTGGLMLDAALSLWDACRNDRDAALQRALRAVAGNVLVRQPMAESVLACVWQVLDICDAPQALPSIDTALDHARRSGSLRTLAPAACFRAAVMLTRGHLAEAISDARSSWEAVTTSSIDVGLPYIGNYYALALLLSGDVNAAAQVVKDVRDRCPADVSERLFGEAEIALSLAQGDLKTAYDTCAALRDECRALAITNPLFPDWRSPMIQCAQQLGRLDEARDVARELVQSAETWGTPRARGRALRMLATVTPGAEAVELLTESAKLLADTQARLEQAQTACLLGRSLMELGHTQEARGRLQQGYELAGLCGAEPLKQEAAAMLQALGTRPRAVEVTGIGGLTPSEAKVAALAAEGKTNKEIAQQLYVTVKTVEQHLTGAFRKLGVTSRVDLPKSL
ncbi:BTAD domain-containing putative transcriptional regulator [Catellatospora aurea]|uniref:BTAD domain-containing putative transcriptional regulator n=1 Tax=Catellatospora aurea TaxID=1337874 RepID=A0ABW2H6D4_9ACTN